MSAPTPGDGQPPDGTGGPHCFVADVEAPVLSNDDHHHLSKALRLVSGDACTVGDGDGRWRPCAFGEAPEPIGPVVRVERPAEPFGVGFVVVKGERPERIVAGLTELGIDRIMVVASDRSVVRWDQHKAERNIERLRRVARESAMQSRQVHLPVVDDLVGFDALVRGETVVPMAQLLLADPRAERSLASVLAESEAGRAGGEVSGGVAGQVVLVGPEGGWADRERDALEQHVRLPGRVLRAETAAVTAGAILAGHRLETAARRG